MSARGWALLLGPLWLVAAPACEDDSQESTRSQDAAVLPDGAFHDAAADDPIEPADALAGACTMMGMMGASRDECSGVEEYGACVRDECGLQDCLDDECSDSFECLQDADDVCDNDCLVSISTACEQCLASWGMCAARDCVALLMCGDVTEGGACDQLEECCDELPEEMAEPCRLSAAGARSGGEPAERRGRR
jgi:hypothetical protein